MVPSSRALRSTGAKPPAEWQPPEDVAAWLRLNRCDATGLRQDGGFLFRIEASDPDAAVPRVAEDMIREPRRTLALVQKHATNAFRCLYRHRNMVLHGALTNAVALRAGLRTAAPPCGSWDRSHHSRPLRRRAPATSARGACPTGPRHGWVCRRSRHHRPLGHGLAELNEVIRCLPVLAKRAAAGEGMVNQVSGRGMRWLARRG